MSVKKCGKGEKHISPLPTKPLQIILSSAMVFIVTINGSIQGAGIGDYGAHYL